jgi:hypothetical protein
MVTSSGQNPSIRGPHSRHDQHSRFPLPPALAGLGHVDAAEHEETVQGLVVDLRREPTLRIRQERTSALPTLQPPPWGHSPDDCVGF